MTYDKSVKVTCVWCLVAMHPGNMVEVEGEYACKTIKACADRVEKIRKKGRSERIAKKDKEK